VTVPKTASAEWPGWSEIASLASYRMAHDVDGTGAIHLAEWKDGIVVHREDGVGWVTSDPLARDVVFWAVATNVQGRDYVARAWANVYGDPMQVEVSAWNGARWDVLGSAFAAGHLDIYDSDYAGEPSLAVDSSGRPILAFHASGVGLQDGTTLYGVRSFRWDGGWADLGGTFALPGGRILLAPAGAKGFFATSEWDLRRSGNIGCHEGGAHALAYDGTSWSDLAELKLDRRLSDVTGCPYTNLTDESLAVGQHGEPLIAFTEFAAPGGAGHVHLVHWSGTAFEQLADFPDVATPGWNDERRSNLSLVHLASGDLWLSWMKAESQGVGLILYRLRNGQWQVIDELQSTATQFTGSLVCIDAEGNPVVAVTDANGGRVLYRHP